MSIKDDFSNSFCLNFLINYSGMDVLSKRSVWRLLRRRVAHEGASVVLTSHSMEECEHLCDRVAIMAEGRFACIGNTERIKQK